MNVVLMGAANPEVIRLIHAVGKADPSFHVVGFIDNDPAKAGTSFYGIPILGGSAEIEVLMRHDIRFVNLITGSAEKRYETTRDAVTRGAILTNLIHPSVDLTMTSWGVGNYVQDAVTVQAEVAVGDNSSFSAGSVIGHETRIGNSVFLAPSVSISGCCTIGDGTFIGTNATILPRIAVGKWCIVGAGAVVTKNVPDYSVVAGNPARTIREHAVQFKDGNVFE